uniref:Kelch-like ECH-associated protein 1a n=1 Tax=Acanthochromis polyacanthus TaxID=80966 RepID=A0A3Q1GU29_9TELE
MHCSVSKKRLTRDSDFSAIVVPSMHGSGCLDYTVKNHASRSLKVMDEFRRHEMLCDLVLHVTYNNRTVDFKVHRVVLASCSPYFRAMFTSSFKECRASEVTLRDVCPQVVGRLIDFAYTSHITVGETCVLHVLLAAMRYQMEDVAKACCDFLIKHLEPANVIGIARFAEEIGCTELHQRGREYINTHFSEVTKEDEFFSLSHCQLLELISQESLKVLCESEVYKACTDWVRWDMEGRAQYLHALLNAVHIYALPPKFLKNQLLSCPILSKANSCKDFLSKIFQDMTLRKLPPAPNRGTQLIYICYCFIVGCYKFHLITWHMAQFCHFSLHLKLIFSPVFLNRIVKICMQTQVGGRNMSLQNNTESNALCCYNPMTNQWSQRASLNVPRNRVGVGVVDGCIYAVGGSQGSMHHSTVERWDPESNRWSFVCPMSMARLGAGVAACGGNRWNTAEKYQPDTNSWQQLAPMNTIRSGLGLVCMNSYLYAVGGYDGRSQLCSVERYNIVRNIWEPRASMQYCRSAHGITVHQGRIFVFGGFNQHGFLSSVECYCPERNEWTCVTDMPLGRSGMGVAVTMEPCPGSLPEADEDGAT